MTPITQGFNIENIHIKWGVPFKDVKDILSKYSQYPPYEGWSNLRCKCSEIYGLQTTLAEIRAPFDDRPVLQVIYELEPLGENKWGKLHVAYVEQLKKIFGRPTKEESLYDSWYIKTIDKEYAWGSVVYSANWLIGDIRISISVYGGVRHQEGGDSAAGLFVDWLNEKKAAEPFRLKNIALEKELLNYLTDPTGLEKYILTNDQRKFYFKHIDIGDPDVTKDEELRSAQMALYRNDLLQTPNFLQHLLEENEIVVKFIKDRSIMIIANKWDATILKYNNEAACFIDVLPGRGSGEYILQVKDLSIKDSRKSDTLINLTSHIEKITGMQIKRETGYDD